MQCSLFSVWTKGFKSISWWNRVSQIRHKCNLLCSKQLCLHLQRPTRNFCSIEVSKEILNMLSVNYLAFGSSANCESFRNGTILRNNEREASPYCYITRKFSCLTFSFFSKANKHTVHLISLIQFPVVLAFERNSSGHIVSMDGISPRMLDWLTVRYGFT